MTSIQGSPEPISALNRIRILESFLPWTEREPLVDIRNYCPKVVCSEKICPFLRERVADMVNFAQASLPPQFRLKIATALRTLSLQKSGWDRYYERMRVEHPSWPRSALRRATNKYHAPYDQKAPPGHCTGGAVDVILVDAAGEPVDVTSPTEGWEAAYTWSDKISTEARENRMAMVEAMLAAGFSNCRDEYWHYSWGDSAWAVRVGEFECPFGWAYPPVCLETDFPEGRATEMEIESFRDFGGRVVEAVGSCAVLSKTEEDSAENPAMAIGVYWAQNVPVTLNIRWPDAHVGVAIDMGPSLDALEPLNEVDRNGDSFMVKFTPHRDRVILIMRRSPM